jgi:hypothetical protein
MKEERSLFFKEHDFSAIDSVWLLIFSSAPGECNSL